MRTPILEFKDVADANISLAEWQNRLMLNDWLLKIELSDSLKEDDAELSAQVERITENKTAIIRILKKNPYPEHYIKFCAECALVHELLHLKIDICSHEKDDVPGVLYDTFTHQNIEQLAKSFIMAKYNVSLDWWKGWK